MNFSADELFEINAALHGGLRDEGWGALTKKERADHLAAQKAWLQDRIADPRIFNTDRKGFEESLETIGRPEEAERRSREQYYAQPHKTRARRRPGLKLAVNDLLSQVQFFSPAQRAAVDRRLTAKKLPTLRQLEIRLRQKHVRILKRGKIRNAEEY